MVRRMTPSRLHFRNTTVLLVSLPIRSGSRKGSPRRGSPLGGVLRVRSIIRNGIPRKPSCQIMTSPLQYFSGWREAQGQCAAPDRLLGFYPVVSGQQSSVGFHHLFVVAKCFYWNLNRQFGEGDPAAAWT